MMKAGEVPYGHIMRTQTHPRDYMRLRRNEHDSLSGPNQYSPTESGVVPVLRMWDQTVTWLVDQEVEDLGPVDYKRKDIRRG